LRHVIPARRLTWTYLRALCRGTGYSTTALDGYFVALRHSGPWRLKDRIRWSWQWQSLSVVRSLIRRPIKFLVVQAGGGEGDPQALDVESLVGRLLALLSLRHRYTERVEALARLT
jgi:hypothetical protein